MNPRVVEILNRSQQWAVHNGPESRDEQKHTGMHTARTRRERTTRKVTQPKFSLAPKQASALLLFHASRTTIPDADDIKISGVDREDKEEHMCEALSCLSPRIDGKYYCMRHRWRSFRPGFVPTQNMIARFRICLGLIKNEREYNDGLRVAYERYEVQCKALCKGRSERWWYSDYTNHTKPPYLIDMVNENDVHAMFTNLKELYDVSSRLLVDLNDIPHSVLTTQMPITLACYVPEFKTAFTTFLRGYDGAIEAIARVRRESSVFDHFLQWQEYCSAGSTLVSLLSPSVQRLPLYAAYVSKLVNNTGPHDSVMEELKGVWSMLQRLLVEVTTALEKNTIDDQLVVVSAQFDEKHALDNFGFVVASPHRKLVKKGPVRLRNHRTTGLSDAKMFFLFSDVLVRAAETMKETTSGSVVTYTIRQIIPLNNIHVGLPLHAIHEGEVEVTEASSGSTLMMLVCDGALEQEAWLLALNNAIHSRKK